MKEVAENASFIVFFIGIYAFFRYIGVLPWLAMLTAGLLIGIVAELLEETFRNFETDQKIGLQQSIVSYAKTHKLDGVLVGMSLVTIVGVLTGIY